MNPPEGIFGESEEVYKLGFRRWGINAGKVRAVHSPLLHG
jgi:hypothetical protein